MKKRTPVEHNAKPAMVFRTLMDPGTYGLEHGLRPDTKSHRWVINFAFNEGGMGDYINYSAATLWIAKNCPWVEGRLFVSEYLVGLMKEIHKDFPNWEILPGEKAGEMIDPQTPIIGPEIKMNGTNMNPQLLNATGAHLMDLGFAYYTNQCPAPAGATLPRINLPQSRLDPKVKKLQGKYVVIPTGSMTPSRWIEGKHINPLIAHVKEIGLTPVFLGKKNVTSQLSAVFADDINYHDGLDLRDQTSVMDAAAIMQHAVATVGLDCGLLHLAACMEGSKVVFGYNIVEPKDREPRRTWGKTVNVSLTKQELPCSGCQSNVKLMISHTFHRCLYEDNLCIDLLFGDDCAKWKKALKEVLE